MSGKKLIYEKTNWKKNVFQQPGVLAGDNSGDKSNQNGVAVLFNNNFEHKLHNVKDILMGVFLFSYSGYCNFKQTSDMLQVVKIFVFIVFPLRLERYEMIML